MREGALMGVLEAKDFSEEAVMRLAVAPVLANPDPVTDGQTTNKEIRT
jgi:hypothetical protein